MNKTSMMEFILTGLTDKTKLNIPLFIIFLHIYVTTVVCNFGIITVSWVDRHLHKPMYLFLSNLSFVNLMYSSSVTPKMLRDFLSQAKAISFVGSALQMYMFVSFATIDCLILGLMAYDRYIAICSPLTYSVLMNNILSLRLLIAAYLEGLLTALVHTVSVFHLNFCRSNVIDHFFCDIPPLFKLSCSDISVNLVVLVVLGGLSTLGCLILILVSYTYIVLTILRIRTARGRYKAFKTCVSHMAAVTIFYGTVLFMYFRPSTSYVLHQDRVASVFYSILIPMLNPLIYTLRNEEFKEALRGSVRGLKGKSF
ncbi:PREDICTED: olfactory receptor 5F1-like [Nanorana parkeri]|uniref:olfactory receptor 5F1-like n=1 Tax=Nanorana parkeri TaxID=125878 RepID=UPI0008545014|nr:PREDICTED: olfactory receptor 5F1-like [Nanorana parkeri]